MAAPFPGVCVGYLPNRLGPNSQWAAVFPYVDVTAIQDRLDLVVGPDGWSHKVTALDDGTLVVTMAVLGTEHSEVGQGSDRWSQSANAFKRCARHFGIGRFLTQLPIVRLKLGEQIPVNRKGSPYITDQLLAQLRATYERQVRELEGRFGPILPHPGVGAGEHEGEAPTHPEVDQDAASPWDTGAEETAPQPNADGELLRRRAAEKGIGDAELGNLIRRAAGSDKLTPERARLALPLMLQKIPAALAEKTGELIDALEAAGDSLSGEDFTSYEPPAAG